MRLYILRTDRAPVDNETLTLGRELLAACTFTEQDDNFDYHLGEVGRVCLVGPDAAQDARKLCEKFTEALQGDGPAWRYDHVAKAIFELQPEVALDVFFRKTDNWGRSALFRIMVMERGKSPVNLVSREILLAWADQDAKARYPWLAGEIRLLDKPEEAQVGLRWSSIARYLLEHATDRKAVLNAFGWHLEPTSWSGSLADVLTPYVPPIQELLSHPDAIVRHWAKETERRLLTRIEAERARERRTDESFE